MRFQKQKHLSPAMNTAGIFIRDASRDWRRRSKDRSVECHPGKPGTAFFAMPVADYGLGYVGMLLLLALIVLQALLWRQMPQFCLHHSRAGRFVMHMLPWQVTQGPCSSWKLEDCLVDFI